MKKLALLLIIGLAGCQKEEVCEDVSIVGNYMIVDETRTDVRIFTDDGLVKICTNIAGECPLYFPYQTNCSRLNVGANASVFATDYYFENGVLYFANDTHVGGWVKL